MDIELPRFPETEPGQFIQLTCRNQHDDVESPSPEHLWREGEWPTIADPDLIQRQAMLRRPFSVAGRIDGPTGVVLSIIHRVIGAGTDWLSHLASGEAISVLGPLGNRFPKPANGHGILVAGGVGIPPMLYLADRWRAVETKSEPSSPVDLVAFCGTTARDLLPLTVIGEFSDDPADTTAGDPSQPMMNIAEFARFAVPSVITTDDGTFGYHGLVTDALERYLDRTLPSSATDERPTLYTCGPEAMMKRIAAIAAERGLPCYVAVERAMACGMATCQSCVIRKRIGHSTDAWRYALSCTEGPVFDANDLLW